MEVEEGVCQKPDFIYQVKLFHKRMLVAMLVEMPEASRVWSNSSPKSWPGHARAKECTNMHFHHGTYQCDCVVFLLGVLDGHSTSPTRFAVQVKLKLSLIHPTDCGLMGWAVVIIGPPPLSEMLPLVSSFKLSGGLELQIGTD